MNAASEGKRPTIIGASRKIVYFRLFCLENNALSLQSHLSI